MTPRWQILICSIYARHDQLVPLLRDLDRQAAPHAGAVEILVYRDDAGDHPIGHKRTRLVEAATAEHVCFIDDDDTVAADYVSRIIWALRSDPDYVGFVLELTVDGHERPNAYHSLRHQEWSEDLLGYYRNVSHLNPIRRSLALAGLPFEDRFGEDRAWAERVFERARPRTEVMLFAPPVYFYRYSSAGSLFGAGPLPRMGEAPALPAFQYVRQVGDTTGAASAVASHGPEPKEAA